MARLFLAVLICLLLALCQAGAVRAQTNNPRDPGLDAMKYRAIYGRPPPPPEEKNKSQGQAKSQDQAGSQDQTKGQDQNKKAGAEQSKEPEPRYRFSNDPLLNPSNRVGPPAASAPAATSPGASRGSPQAPAASTPASSSRFRRLVVVRVSDQSGKPLSGVQVLVTSGGDSPPQEGMTDSLGMYSLDVPCLPGGEGDRRLHTVQVTSGMSMDSQLVYSDRGNCFDPAEVYFVLQSEGSDRQIEKEYRKRQFLYDEEDAAAKKKALSEGKSGRGAQGKQGGQGEQGGQE